MSFSGHALRENRNGPVVNAAVCSATGAAEREAALAMLDEWLANRRAALGADRNYDTKDFVKDLRGRKVTPNVAQHRNARRGSAINARTARHDGYHVNQKKRKRVEEIFGRLKTIGGMREQRCRRLPKVGWMFTSAAAAYNQVSVRNLTMAAEPPNASAVVLETARTAVSEWDLAL